METMTEAPPDKQLRKRRRNGTAKPAANRAAGPLLDRAAILAAEDLASAEVPVPQWGGKVRVRALSGAERLAYENRCVALRKDGQLDAEGNMKVILLLFVACAVDGAGTPIFTEKDLPALMAKNFEAERAVFEKALELNGMRPDDIEELAGN